MADKVHNYQPCSATLTGIDKPPVSLKWTEAPSSNHNTYPRVVAVDLPDNLPNGNYELLLEVILEDGKSMKIAKRIEVKR